MRAACYFLLGSALAALWAGCETGADQLPPPRATADLVFTAGDRAVETTLEAGNALHILLPPPEQPDVQWEIVSNPGRVLRQITPLRPALAAPGVFEVTFQAVKPPRSRLIFVAIKPGQPEADAEEQFMVEVEVPD